MLRRQTFLKGRRHPEPRIPPLSRQPHISIPALLLHLLHFPSRPSFSCCCSCSLFFYQPYAPCDLCVFLARLLVFFVFSPKPLICHTRRGPRSFWKTARAWRRTFPVSSDLYKRARFALTRENGVCRPTHRTGDGGVSYRDLSLSLCSVLLFRLLFSGPSRHTATLRVSSSALVFFFYFQIIAFSPPSSLTAASLIHSPLSVFRQPALKLVRSSGNDLFL